MSEGITPAPGREERAHPEAGSVPRACQVTPVSLCSPAAVTPGPLPASCDGDCRMYLAGIEMPDDLNDDLVVLIGGLVSWHHHLGCCQILQLIHLQVGWAERSAGCH